MDRRTGRYGSVEKRDGSWRGRYLVDVSGRFERVKRSVISGSVKSMSKSEAPRQLKEIIYKSGINEPTYKIPSVDTFERHVEKWEESYIVRMKPSNQKQLRFVLRKYLMPKWAKVPMEDITAEAVNEWIGARELAHLSPVTLRGIVRTLQFATGKRFGRGAIHYPSRVEEEQEVRCFTSAEVAAILATATGQHGVLFTLAAETGMRAGELYGLRVEDVDFARNIVKVRRSMWEGKAQTPKTSNSYRAIDVQPYVTEMLLKHLAGRTEGLVFLSPHSAPKLRCGRQATASAATPLEFGARRNARLQTFPRFIPHSKRHAD